ncbi:MAG: glucose-6-phosphate dehydrogenase [Actinobacteria bacterium]|nr:glucose-6-phosphate dehydrogenase [Actinomycetota bacterium]
MPDTEPENPFAADVPGVEVKPSTYVLFGASGDLAAKKLLPAVYNLYAEGRLPERFRLLGVGSSMPEHNFRDHMINEVTKYSRSGVDEKVLNSLLEKVDYIQGDFTKPALFDKLKKNLTAGDSALGGPTRRLFYLAVAPRFFGPIGDSLHKVGLARGADPESVLMIEKPFGHDLESAIALNNEVTSAFDETHILRLDHYLGKETVQNLLVFRFANGIFEPLWNRRYIDHVQITAAEDLGIGTRAGYYDQSGAIRDIIQNHVMQLVALTAMEPPATFDADSIRDEKEKALKSIRCVGSARGQYTAGDVDGGHVPGYLEEPNVPATSTTETYAALKFEVNNWRWAGTPFYVRAGKRMPRRSTEITIAFRPVPHMPFSDPKVAQSIRPNLLTLSIQPNEGASLRIEAKAPGAETQLRPVRMDFLYGETFTRETPEAYERLILDALRGDATLFTRADEVEQAWRIVDPVIEAWKQNDVPLEPYVAGTPGPDSAEALIRADGRKWRRL